ncbi:MAG: putative pyridoxine/pyridoxamine 5-phosphate oxidase [Acidimicrobiales bacterium]|nr:putative pyridoxine/pyridoxamine 5-phosphate oxidase [Acidimicrobiales bacterium]
MELADALAFARGRHQGVLTTIRSSGRPQLSNIVYALGADDVARVSVTDSRAKTKNLRRDPRASLYVVGDDFWSYVVLEGTAELTPVATDPADETVDELVALYREAAGEHSDWDEFRRDMVANRRLAVRLHVDHAYGMVPPS